MFHSLILLNFLLYQLKQYMQEQFTFFPEIFLFLREYSLLFSYISLLKMDHKFSIRLIFEEAVSHSIPLQVFETISTELYRI